MTCNNANRKPGYYVLQRAYVPSGEYHLEPVFVPDVTSKHECLCPICTPSHRVLEYEQMRAKAETLLREAKRLAPMDSVDLLDRPKPAQSQHT